MENTPSLPPKSKKSLRNQEFLVSSPENQGHTSREVGKICPCDDIHITGFMHLLGIFITLEISAQVEVKIRAFGSS